MKDKNLLLRVVTALALLPALFWVIWRGEEPLAVVVALAALVGVLEFYGMTLGEQSLRVPGALVVFAIPLALLNPENADSMVFGLFALLILGSLSWRLFEKKPLESAVHEVGMAVFGAVYLSLMGFLVKLRLLGEPSSWSGGGWLFLACAATWGADTGAYFAGRFFGESKLFPRISPKKTWAGFVGGILSAMFAGTMVRWLLLEQLSLMDVVALGLICGGVGTVGDLVESMLKRSAKVKDSGSILPGHGGMLDRIDALMFTAPLVYAYAVFVVGS